MAELDPIDINPFHGWLALQLALQQAVFVDPRTLDEEERATFMVWNHSAAIIELGEAMQEVGWKPWATSRHLHDGAFIDEIVDALHFIGNMILAAAESEDESPVMLANKVWMSYQNKVRLNILRQQEGYTGLNKCKLCGRDLTLTPKGSYVERRCPVHGDQEGIA